MSETERLAAFEAMLAAVRENHAKTDETMRRLREQGREKTATYRQLMGNRMVYQNLLTLYGAYGLLDDKAAEKTTEKTTEKATEQATEQENP